MLKIWLNDVQIFKWYEYRIESFECCQQSPQSFVQLNDKLIKSHYASRRCALGFVLPMRQKSHEWQTQKHSNNESNDLLNSINIKYTARRTSSLALFLIFTKLSYHTSPIIELACEHDWRDDPRTNNRQDVLNALSCDAQDTLYHEIHPRSISLSRQIKWRFYIFGKQSRSHTELCVSSQNSMVKCIQSDWIALMNNHNNNNNNIRDNRRQKDEFATRHSFCALLLCASEGFIRREKSSDNVILG